MDCERERGRLAGLKSRRLETAEWARSFISLLEQARTDFREEFNFKPSCKAYADWLNDERREIPTRRGGKWASETVKRLFNIHLGLIDGIETEFDIEIAINRFRRKTADAAGRAKLLDREVDALKDRARKINDANRLSAELQGHRYEDVENPPVLRPVGKQREARDKLYAISRRRKATEDHVLAIVPHLARAHAETDGSNQALADWLNARNHKTLKGKVWRIQTIDEFASVEDLLIREAEAEHKSAIIYERQFASKKASRGGDYHIIRSERDVKIAEADADLDRNKSVARDIGEKLRMLIQPTIVITVG